MKKKERANEIIKNHMYLAVGAGLIPVPIVDFVAVSGIQIDMLKKLADVYDVDFQQNQVKAVLSAISGAGVARLAAGFTKVIPFVGSILGGITMSVLSGASTYAVGEVFKNHFANGGNLADIDLDEFTKYYKEKFEQGKRMAKDMEMDQKSKNGDEDQAPLVTFEEAILEPLPNTSDKITQLRELAQLKNDGIITAAEFDKMKKDLIG